MRTPARLLHKRHFFLGILMRSVVVVVVGPVLALLALMLAGCPPPPKCTFDSDCGAGESCTATGCVIDKLGEGEGEGEGQGGEGEGQAGEGEGEGQAGEGEGEGQAGEGEGEGEGEGGAVFVGNGIADLYAADSANLSVTLSGVIVTALVPAVGNDPAGFFIQEAGAAGPAAFVDTSNITLAVPLAVGDVINATATARVVTTGLVRVTGLSDIVTAGAPADVETIRQDVSGIDMLAGLDGLQAEAIAFNGTIAVVGAAQSSGSLHTALQITTAGVPVASANVVIRVPDAVVAALGTPVKAGCTVAFKGNMWRFTQGTSNKAQPSVWDAADLVISNCPATSLVSAAATSSTNITLTFSAAIDAASVTTAGTQFTLDSGTVSAAVVSGATVALTTTALPDGAHTVSVDATLRDVAGGSVTAGSASFSVGGGPSFVISEVEFDDAGTDDQEFVEIANLDGQNAVDLTPFDIVFIDGATGNATKQALSGSLAPNGVLVVGMANVQAPTTANGGTFVLTTLALQNGPDGIALWDRVNHVLVDSFAWKIANNGTTLAGTIDAVAVTLTGTSATDTTDKTFCRTPANGPFVKP